MKKISSYLIVQDLNGMILLVQRADIPLWVIPGGHIERGESPKDAAERELFEETGLTVKTSLLIAKYQPNNKFWCKYLYFSRMFKGKLKENSEVRRIGWFYTKQLPSPMTVYEKRKIEDSFLYKQRTILRVDKINHFEEILHQLKNPIFFIWLLVSLVKEYTVGSRQFKIKL